MPSETQAPADSSSSTRVRRAVRVIIVSSVAFTFISHWRTAAVVLCDLSSTAYYIGAIVESAIGKAAPWFILAVMLFSYGMRSVYIESCALFVRGGVYRVVKEAMGGFLAKLSVSALLFDYVLTGPCSGVSAGQYIVGLGLEALTRYAGIQLDENTRQGLKSWGSVAIACGITLYFFWENLRGIPESSEKALKIMIAMTIMAVILLGWAGVTLAVKGTVNPLPTWKPDLQKKVEVDSSGKTVHKINVLTGEQEDPLGFIGKVPSIAEPIRAPASWWSLVGLIGLFIAFGHSILAMSGEETLAQVYREVESPKLPNFKKAAFTVFVYSFILTGSVNLLAVLLVPDSLRMGEYYDNWIGGLAMHMAGPLGLRLLLNAFVVVVGFLILAGAVNTSIIGSNGVLNRVAEDGVLPDWFLKPHRRYGTTSRILWLITVLQLFTIVASRGNVILLGEAYAFGVVWSFTFKTLSMVVLRFKNRSPREFMVPGNVKVGGVVLPIGVSIIFLIMLLSALANLVTKQIATISGLIFTAVFLAVFMLTERHYEKKRRGAKHEHIEQFNKEDTQEVSAAILGLSKPYRKLVAIRSTQNLFMLEKALAETDPDTTDLVIMTAKLLPKGGEESVDTAEMDAYDKHLMTAVVERAEKAGKPVIPLIVPTNNPLHAVLTTAKGIQAQEVVIGASNKFTAEVQLDQMAFYWINLHAGKPPGLTVRILGRDRDVYSDLEGGNRIPKAGERQARSVTELRASGVGVKRVLLIHDGTLASSDLFRSVLTMLDPEVVLGLVGLPRAGSSASLRLATPSGGLGHSASDAPAAAPDLIQQDQQQAERVGRKLQVFSLNGDPGPEVVRLAREGNYDLIVLALPEEQLAGTCKPWAAWTDHVLSHAPCRVFLASRAALPQEVAAS